MAINVECPACGKMLKAPSSAAGKRAKCPGCNASVTVPAGEVSPPAPAAKIPMVEPLAPLPPELATPASASKASLASKAATSPKATPAAMSAAATATASDKISIPCANCGKTLKAPAALAGKRGKCPACGGVIAVSSPAGSEEIGLAEDIPRVAPLAPLPAVAQSPVATQASRSAAASNVGLLAASAAPTMSISCPQCRSTWKAPAAKAGQRVQCPRCSSLITLPQMLWDAEVVDAEEESQEYSLAEPAAGQASAPSPFTDEDFAVAKPATDPDRKPCPQCGELIAVGAAKCRFCDAIFDPTLRKAEEKKKKKKKSSSGGRSQPSIVGGLATMAIAVIWFVCGIVFLDRIFFWPPIMFIGGLVSFLKGCFGVASDD